MPTQRQHGGAPLIPIQINRPGFFGLNTEAGSALLTPEWATVLNNVVFDGAGRAGLRKGFVSETASAVAGVIQRVHEFIKADGTSETISSTDADIFSGRSTLSSIEGSLSISEGNIKFLNFNDKCIALGTGSSSNPSVYTGSGNFATVTVNSGTAPTGRIGLSAFGRLWVCDSDRKVIRYCALIDETRWAVVDGGGTIDMSKVWPSGQDTIMAIEEFAGDLVIFGKNNIVIWTDGQGSTLGIDPTNMYISDSIPGVGCVTQFATARAKGDLWFLSASGIQTLSRAMQNKTTPTVNLSRNIQTDLLAFLAAETDDDDITLVYSPAKDMVLCVFPQSDRIIYFDTRGQMEDQTYRLTIWVGDFQTIAYHVVDRELYGSMTALVGEVVKYTSNADLGVAYDFSYQSGWLEFGELNQYLKFVKRLTTFLFIDAATTINFTLNYDFNTVSQTVTKTTVRIAGSEFNVSEFSGGGAGIGYIDPALRLVETEFSGGVSLQTLTVPTTGGGQYIKVGCNLSTATSDFSLQQINLFAKIGRIA